MGAEELAHAIRIDAVLLGRVAVDAVPVFRVFGDEGPHASDQRVDLAVRELVGVGLENQIIRGVGDAVSPPGGERACREAILDFLANVRKSGFGFITRREHIEIDFHTGRHRVVILSRPSALASVYGRGRSRRRAEPWTGRSIHYDLPGMRGLRSESPVLDRRDLVSGSLELLENSLFSRPGQTHFGGIP
jgi:hypothetical protein